MIVSIVEVHQRQEEGSGLTSFTSATSELPVVMIQSGLTCIHRPSDDGIDSV